MRPGMFDHRGSPQIESPCPDHFFHRIGYEVSHGTSLFNAIPDECGGNVQHGRFNHFYVRMIF